MSKLYSTAGRNLMLLIGLIILTACSPATPTAAPTADLGAIRTEVAATVLAQVPQLCALTPTVTPTFTTTPTATNTVTITATTTLAASGTPGTLAPSPDKAKWAAQTIQDGTRFAPGEAFNMTWTIQNVGTTTWTAGYRLRFYSGNAFGAPSEVPLSREVKPNETIDITIAMKAPATTGEYRSDWVLSNELRRNFNEPVFLKITVVKPGTTVTTTATSAPASATPSATPAVPTITPSPSNTP